MLKEIKKCGKREDAENMVKKSFGMVKNLQRLKKDISILGFSTIENMLVKFQKE